MSIKLTSKSFAEGAFIPSLHACTGKNISPELSWSDIPEQSKSIAIICDDPDAPAGVWVHWVIFNIPVTMKSLSENQSQLKTLPNGIKQGTNDFRKYGYSGPCPPSGIHRYYFKIYALDTLLELEAGSIKAQLLKAMEGHILAEGQLMGKFRK